MARGPLPAKEKRRVNTPTIPTTNLPLEGRAGPVPRIPKWVQLHKAGRAWWRWAWSTPQAAGWAPGHEAVVARRATLEDDLAAIGSIEADIDLASLLGIAEKEQLRELEFLLGSIKRLAVGKLQILKEMRELDRDLGLTPKAMAALRWEVVNTASPEVEPAAGVSNLDARRRRLASGAS